MTVIDQTGRRGVARATLVGLLLLAGSLGAVATGPAAHGDAATPDAVVSGRVVDSRTGAGVADATVQLQRKYGPNTFGGIGGHPIHTASDGTFTITGLAPGTYRLGFDATFDTVGGWYHGTDLGTAEDIAVADHSTTALGDLAAAAAAHLRGRVLDPQTGGLLRGIYVSAGGRHAEAGPGAVYDIGGLTAGSYVVTTSGTADRLATSWSPSPGGPASPVTVGAGGVRDGIDLTPARAGHLVGTVRTASFDRASRASLYVVGVDGTVGVSTATAADDGSYDVGGLATGTYAVSMGYLGAGGWWRDAVDQEDATRVSVVAGQQNPLDLRLPSPSSIGGTVTDSETGQPLRGVQVTTNGRATTTGGDGTYVFTDLPAGRHYTVIFRDPGHLTSYYPDELRVEQAADVVLHGSEARRGVDAAMVPGDPELLPGGRIRGTVVNRDGHPVSGSDVAVFRRDPVEGWVTAYSTGTDASGRYVVSHLEPGRYRLQAGGYRAHGGVYWGGSATAQGSPDLVIDEGTSLDGIDVTLPRTATLAGTLTDGSAGPLAERLVEVTPTVGDENDASHASRGATLSTDASGRWSVPQLPPGDYRVSYHCAHVPGDPDYSPTPPPVALPLPPGGLPGTPGGGTLPASGPVGGTAVVTVTEGVDLAVDGVLSESACTPPTAPPAAAPTATAAAPGPPAALPGPGAAAPPASLVVVQQPRLRGPARAGARLSVTRGGFLPSPERVDVTWYVGHRRLRAPGSTLVVRPGMVGRRITSRVTVTLPGFAPLVLEDRSAQVRPSR